MPMPFDYAWKEPPTARRKAAAMVALTLLFFTVVFWPSTRSGEKRSQPVTAPVVAKTPGASPYKHLKTVRKTPAADPDSRGMYLARMVQLQTYTYRFEGTVTHHGKPFSHASVLARVSTSQGLKTQGAISEDDGSYTIEMKVAAAHDEPVDWALEAFTPEFHKVEQMGRRIVTKEDTTVVVANPVEFLASAK